VRGSKVAARIELDRLPVLPDSAMHMRGNVCPAGSKANRAFVADFVQWADGTPFTAEPADDSDREVLASLACDAQTSGGLLLCVPRETSRALVDELRAAGMPAERIGTLSEGAGIELA
jgi:selenide,water dikinase